SRRISDASWIALARRAAEAVGLRRDMILLQSDQEPMPMVWGVLRPRLLLPTEADEWSPQRQRVVLLHELAHTRRHDCLAKMIAHVACSLYWFNPMCWVAFKLMQKEAEAACDDLVLASGHRPSDYATHLLEIASGLKSGILTAYSSIAMARKSKLEGRLLAILDPKRNRRRLTRIGVLIAVLLIAGLVVPISIMRATAGGEAAAKTQEGLNRKNALVKAAKGAGKGQHRNLLETLAGKADSLDACYDILIKNMLDGRYEAVQAALRLRDKAAEYVFPGYRFAKLRARNEGAIYWRYKHSTAQLGRPNSRQAAEFRRLAKSCTKAYEEAFRLAPSRFEKMCLYARWHELHADRRYEADSKLMRSGSPLARTADSPDPQLAKQVEAIRKAVTEGLKDVQLKKPLTAEAQTRFVEVFANEYSRLACVGVPESIFKELIRDIPSFLTTAIDEAVLRDAEKQRLTIRFYLWQAIAGPRPGRVEREVIAEQIDYIAKKMQAKFDDALPVHELFPDGAQAAERFRKVFRKYRDNRFVAYYKRAIWPHEFGKANKYDKSHIEGLDAKFEDYAKFARSDLNMWDQMEPSRVTHPPDNVARWLEEARRSIQKRPRTVNIAAVWSYARRDKPILYQQVPGMTIGSSGGTVNDHGIIWVFTIGACRSVPSYPWKKIISDAESCESSAEKAAKEFLKAIRDGGIQKVKNLIVEAPPHWTKERMTRMVKELRDEVYAKNPQRLTNIRETALKGLWKWAAVRVEGPKGPNGQYLLVILKRVKINDRDWKWRVRLVGDSGPNVPPPPLKDLLEKHVARFTGNPPATQPGGLMPKGFAVEFADRFAVLLRRQNLRFLTEQNIASVRTNMVAFCAAVGSGKASKQIQKSLLASLESYVPLYFTNDDETYLAFQDRVDTLKVKLWWAMSAGPLAVEQAERRNRQRQWMHDLVNATPENKIALQAMRLSPGGLQAKANSQLRHFFEDPLCPLYHIMTDQQFQAFRDSVKKHLARVAQPGRPFERPDSVPYMCLYGAFTVRLPWHNDPKDPSRAVFEIKLPFNKRIIGSESGGTNTNLRFASNAAFRGKRVQLDTTHTSGPPRNAVNVVTDKWLNYPRALQRTAIDSPKRLAWVQQHKMDLAMDMKRVALVALRGGKLARLPTSDWQGADATGTLALRGLIQREGSDHFSVANLPLWPYSSQNQEPVVFLALQTAEGRIVVVRIVSRQQHPNDATDGTLVIHYRLRPMAPATQPGKEKGPSIPTLPSKVSRRILHATLMTSAIGHLGLNRHTGTEIMDLIRNSDLVKAPLVLELALFHVDAKSTAMLVELLQATDPDIALNAARGLAYRGRKDGVVLLEKYASGGDTGTMSELRRDRAAWALLALGEKLPQPKKQYSASPLPEILAAQLKGKAIQDEPGLLKKMFRKALYDKLVMDANNHRFKGLRLTADEAVDRIQNSSDSRFRRVATLVLGLHSGIKARTKLVELLKDDDPLVALHAARWLAYRGQRQGMAVLKKCAIGKDALSSSEFEREAAAWALLALGERPPRGNKSYRLEILNQLASLPAPATQLGGKVVKGLRVSIRAEKKRFVKGQPILIHWKIENVGKVDRTIIWHKKLQYSPVRFDIVQKGGKKYLNRSDLRCFFTGAHPSPPEKIVLRPGRSKEATFDLRYFMGMGTLTGALKVTGLYAPKAPRAPVAYFIGQPKYKDAVSDRIASNEIEIVIAEPATKPSTQPGIMKATDNYTPQQLVERFLELTKAGDPRAAELMTKEFDPQCWRFVVWRSAGNAANEMKEEFGRLRTRTLRDLDVKQWEHAKLTPRQVVVSGNRAVAWVSRSGDGERQLLLKRQAGHWRIAGLCDLNLWSLEWQLNSAVTNPGSTWGKLLWVQKSKDELAKAPLYVDLDTGRTYQPPQDGATDAWIKANGIDIGLGAYGPLPRGVRYHPPQGTFNFGARMQGVYSYWLVTPDNAPVLLAHAPPARKEGGGQFSGQFLIQTREGTIGLLNAWSTGLKFIPLTQQARKNVHQQLGPYDTACLFLHAASHPAKDKPLLTKLVGPGLDVERALKTINGEIFKPQPMAFKWMYADDSNALAITYPHLRVIYKQRRVWAFAVILSKRSGTWLVEDVRELQNKAIREAAEKFLAEHPRASVAPATQPAVDKAKIDRLVKQLGSGIFKEREEAQKSLVRIGRPAVMALDAAGKQANLEAATRAKQALKEIEKLTKNTFFRGQVVGIDGKPSANARVTVVAWWWRLDLTGRTIRFTGSGFPTSTTTKIDLVCDERGRFDGQFKPGHPAFEEPALKVNLQAVAWSAGGKTCGFAQGTCKWPESIVPPLTVTLVKPASATIRVVNRNGPVLNAKVTIVDKFLNQDGTNLGLGKPVFGWKVRSLSKGNYQILCLVPGRKYSIFAKAPMVHDSAGTLPFTLKPGQAFNAGVLKIGLPHLAATKPATQPTEKGSGPGKQDIERFRRELALAKTATTRIEKAAHLRKALLHRPNHPDNIAIEFKLAGHLENSVHAHNRERREAMWAEARAVYERIAKNYNHMRYYTKYGPDAPRSPEVLVPFAAVMLGNRHPDSIKGRQLHYRAMVCLKQTHDRRKKDWLNEPAPPPFDPESPFDGGEMGKAKWKSRMHAWRKRQEAAADGNVLTAIEMYLVRAAAKGYVQRHEAQEAVTAMRKIISDFPGTPMARFASEQLKAATARPVGKRGAPPWGKALNGLRCRW
ncbi:MAG: hypothetical protein KAV00_12645, partial [Phycisphaerae bacterium]|nr:hypothetical protein [Phycisphaerae bacterium]